jgi:hypothetical protein
VSGDDYFLDGAGEAGQPATGNLSCLLCLAVLSLAATTLIVLLARSEPQEIPHGTPASLEPRPTERDGEVITSGGRVRQGE